MRREHEARTQQRLRQQVVFVEEVAVQGVELGPRHVDLAERVLRLLDLLAVTNLAVADAGRPLGVEHVVGVLQRHRQPFEPVRQLDGDRREIDAAGLLEVGELRNLLAVEEHLPADAPGAERRRLPVVLLEAQVVGAQVDAAGLEALQVQLLDLVRRRLEDHLELMVLEQAVRVLAEPAVGRAARRLHVSHVPRLRPEHAQERLGMHRAGSHLDVERLLQQAAA